MIRIETCSIFATNAQAIVNPVNCAGVMGKGLALKFKELFPECFEAYKKRCDEGTFAIGTVQLVEVEQDYKHPQWVINFPTKKHWIANSKLEYIEQGMEALVNGIKAAKITSIAIPKLGCGEGGLVWSDVRPIIVHALAPLVNDPKSKLGVILCEY